MDQVSYFLAWLVSFSKNRPLWNIFEQISQPEALFKLTGAKDS